MARKPSRIRGQRRGARRHSRPAEPRAFVQDASRRSDTVASVDLPAQATPGFCDPVLDPDSLAVMVGEPVGVFDDRWVSRHASFAFRAQGVLTSMSVEIWAPPGAEPFILSLRGEDELDITLNVPRGQIAVLQYPIYAAPFTDLKVELVSATDQALNPPDLRRAAYILRSLSFS